MKGGRNSKPNSGRRSQPERPFSSRLLPAALITGDHGIFPPPFHVNGQEAVYPCRQGPKRKVAHKCKFFFDKPEFCFYNKFDVYVLF
jgi:hypothetical protein